MLTIQLVIVSDDLNHVFLLKPVQLVKLDAYRFTCDDANDPIVLKADQATWFDDDRFIHG
jgi:hypothetical protein